MFRGFFCDKISVMEVIMQVIDNFNRFCVLLDCSRNAVPTVDFLKTYIDDIAKMGYNALQLYTEDTYEIDGEPFFGYLRGRFTKNELKDINAYAKKRGVEIIPCIQTLAHLNAPLRWSAYRDILDCRFTLLCEENKTYDLIDKMFKTMRECFDTKYINIGMDESPFVGLGNYLRKHGYKSQHDVILNHLNKVCDIAKKYDFKPIMWSDMWFSIASKNEQHRSSEPFNFTDELLSKIPENISLCYWDYYSPNPPVTENMFNEHKRFNREIWFAGSVWSSRGYAPFNLFAMKSHNSTINACKKHGIKNVIITAWGDDGAENSRLATYSGLYHAICVAKGITDPEEMDKGFYKLFGISLNNHAKLDLPNMIEEQFDLYSFDKARAMNPSKYMLYQDPFMGIFDYTYNKDSEKYYDVHAKTLAKFADNEKFGYVFDTLSKLCSVLSIKYGLGVKTRSAYKNGDKKELKSLIKSYNMLHKKLDDLYTAFKYQWHKENKSVGWEVSDQRLGGLIKRVESCKNTLNDYLKGKIDKIEDLEQEFLPDNKSNTFGKAILSTHYVNIISANVVSYPELI